MTSSGRFCLHSHHLLIRIAPHNGGQLLLQRIEAKVNPLPDSVLSEIMKMCDYLWRRSKQEPECLPGRQVPLAGLALNHVSGVTVSCAVALAMRERGRTPDIWNGLSSELRDFLSGVITDNCAHGIYGRVMMAIMLSQLFYLDPVWTRERLVPLFDWGGQPEAECLWEAHGSNGRVFSDIAQDLLPLYAGTINQWESLRQEARKGLAQKYVMMLCWDHVPGSYRLELARCVGTSGGPNTKAAFAMMIGQMLHHANVPVKTENWDVLDIALLVPIGLPVPRSRHEMKS